MNYLLAHPLQYVLYGKQLRKGSHHKNSGDVNKIFNCVSRFTFHPMKNILIMR